MNKIQAFEQMRKVLQMFASTLSDEQAMEVATIYDEWKIGKNYAVGDFFTYGNNFVGDPQLYKVVQAHTSQSTFTPDIAHSLYVAIGLDDEGFPVWSQPTGAHDAYNIGDVVNYNGVLYESQINGNTYIPGTDDRWWKLYESGDSDV